MGSAVSGNTKPAMVAEINELLGRWQEGEREAYDRLISLLHKDLGRLARIQLSRERRNHTLETNDLVGKLYLKMLNARTVPWETHAHFLNSALRTMRQIMIDHARGWDNRPDGKKRASTDRGAQLANGPDALRPDNQLTQLLVLNQAIDKMAEMDQGMAHIADLRLILGLTLEETARELNLPINKVKREWLLIRSFLAETVWNNQAT